MLKRILFIILGIIVASAVVYVVEFLGHQVYPPPEGITMENADKFLDYIQNKMPTGAMLFVVLAHFSGTIAGSFVTAKLNKDKPYTGMIVGTILMIFGIILAFLLPHPLWMMILDIALYLPAAWIGVKFANQKNRI